MIFGYSPTYIPCNTAECRCRTFPTCYGDSENCSEQPKTNEMGIHRAHIKFLTFVFLAPPIWDSWNEMSIDKTHFNNFVQKWYPDRQRGPNPSRAKAIMNRLQNLKCRNIPCFHFAIIFISILAGLNVLILSKKIPLSPECFLMCHKEKTIFSVDKY